MFFGARERLLAASVGLCVFLVLGCNGATPSTTATQTAAAVTSGAASNTPSADWTIMVYSMATNTVVEAGQIADVVAAEQVGSTANVNILWEMETITLPFSTPNDTTAKRFRVQKGTSTTEITSPVAPGDALGQIDVCSPAEVARFVTWAVTNYPAKHYAIVFSDHGGQWMGCGENDVSGTDCFNYAQTFKPFVQAAGAAFGQRIDVWGYDACLMQGIEVATLVHPYAKYLVGSTTETVCDWDYADWLNDLVATPTMDGTALAQDIVARTGDFFAGKSSIAFSPNTDGVPTDDYAFSAVDTDATNALLPVIQRFVGNHQGSLGAEISAVGRARFDADANFMTVYPAGQPNGVDANEFVDMKNFVDNLASQVADSDLTAISTGLASAVIAFRHGSLRPDATGLSLYMPLTAGARTLSPFDQSSGSYSVTDFAQATGWDGYLGAFFGATNAITQYPAVTITNQSATTLPAQGSVTFTFDAAGTDVVTVGGRLMRDDASGATSEILGDVPQPVSGAVASNSFVFDGSMPALFDGTNASFLDARLMNRVGLCYADVQITPPGGAPYTALALVSIDPETHAGSLVAFEQGQIGAGGTKCIPFASLVGSTIQTIHRVVDLTTRNVTTVVSTVQLQVTSASPLNLSVVKGVAASGSYRIECFANDFAGNWGFAPGFVTVP